MNEEIILQTLQEIRADQKIIIDKVTRMDRDWEISRNGYTPHEVVELLHFVNDLKVREEKKAENIRKAIINWVTPILLSGVILGLLQMYKG
jgi:hypothetical protein